VGLYDPDSEIRVRVLQHHQTATINAAWFQQTLATALAKRAPVLNSATNACRLVYGESDRLPGIIVDQYSNTLVLKLYSRAWLPHLSTILTELVDLATPQRVVLRLNRALSEDRTHSLSDGLVVYGEALTGDIPFIENGLHFAADVQHGHKTGFFFDQRDNRQYLRGLTAHADVLDVFTYTGAFALYAAAGGARSVTCVDISAPALEAAKQNFALNPSIAEVPLHTQVGDAFTVMRDLVAQQRRFEVVVIDPPAFAKRQSEVDGALRAYRQLAELGDQLVLPGGLLVMASCSSRVNASTFYNTVRDTLTQPIVDEQRFGHALDHPVTYPEGEYLKCTFLRVGQA
jgi:23S rRNA (cytosine1962-C5)-methyltransferase